MTKYVLLLDNKMALDLAKYKTSSTTPTASSSLDLGKYKVNAAEQEPTPFVGGYAGKYIDSVSGAFGAAITKAKEGFSQARNATTLPALLEGSTKLAAGGVEAVSSPLAPIGSVVQINPKLISTISDRPDVQRFADSQAGHATSRIVEDVANLNTVAGGVAGFGPGVRPTVNAVSTLPGKAKSLLPDPQVTAIEYSNKALSNTGKSSASGLLTKDNKRLQGLETMYTLTKDTLIKAADGTTFKFDPTNIADPHQLLQAFVQAKNTIWQKVEAGLERGSSVRPNYAPVEQVLQDVIDNSASRALVSHATARLAELRRLGTQGVQGAQRYLQEELNPRIGAAIRGATDAPALNLDVKLAHAINDALDRGLEQVKDAAIGSLKDQYASLKSLEPDMVKMVQKIVRQPGGGIPQYINDFGNINLIEAVFSHNPGLYVAKAAGMKVLSRVLQGQRDALENLSKAFQAISKYKGNAQPPAEPPTLALPAGVRGTPSQVNSGGTIDLPPRLPSSVEASERLRLPLQKSAGEAINAINSKSTPQTLALPPGTPGTPPQVYGPTINLPSRGSDNFRTTNPPFKVKLPPRNQ